jgi:hypothetical protein
MPFLNQIISFINDDLKAGSLSKDKLQPAKFYGLTTIVSRSKKSSKEPTKLELLPAIVDATGKDNPITLESKLALQVYHKLNSKTYSVEKKSYGDEYNIKCISDLSMVVITNSKITGKTKDVLEPLLIFGMPQKLSTALFVDLKINNCLITPVSSNMDAMAVYRQEYPQSDYYLTEQMSMFLIRYKIELSFSQQCVEQCLCD